MAAEPPRAEGAVQYRHSPYTVSPTGDGPLPQIRELPRLQPLTLEGATRPAGCVGSHTASSATPCAAPEFDFPPAVVVRHRMGVSMVDLRPKQRKYRKRLAREYRALEDALRRERESLPPASGGTNADQCRVAADVVAKQRVAVKRIEERQRNILEALVLYKERKYNAINALDRYLVFLLVLLTFSAFSHGFSLSTTEWVRLTFKGRHTSVGVFQSCDSILIGQCDNRVRVSKPRDFVDPETGAVLCTVSSEFARRYAAVLWTFSTLCLMMTAFAFLLALWALRRPTRTGSVGLLSILLLLSNAFGIVVMVSFQKFSFCARSMCQVAQSEPPLCTSGTKWGYGLFIAAICINFCSAIVALCMRSYVQRLHRHAVKQLRMEKRRAAKHAALKSLALELAAKALEEERGNARRDHRLLDTASDGGSATEMLGASTRTYLTMQPRSNGTMQTREVSVMIVPDRRHARSRAGSVLALTPEGEDAMNDSKIGVPDGPAGNLIPVPLSPTPNAPPGSGKRHHRDPTALDSVSRRNEHGSAAETAPARILDLNEEHPPREARDNYTHAANPATPLPLHRCRSESGRQSCARDASPNVPLSEEVGGHDNTIRLKQNAKGHRRSHRRRGRHHSRHRHRHEYHGIVRDFDPTHLTAKELGVEIEGATDWVYDDASDLYYSFELNMFWDPLSTEYYHCVLKTWLDRPDLVFDFHEVNEEWADGWDCEVAVPPELPTRGPYSPQAPSDGHGSATHAQRAASLT